VRTKIRPTIYNFPLSGREGEGKPSNTAATKYCMEIVAKAHNPNIKRSGSKSKQVFSLSSPHYFGIFDIPRVASVESKKHHVPFV
jgi:hypothetical protein